MKQKFTTKAGTLSSLQGQIKTARIAPLVYFTVGNWQKNKNYCLIQLKEHLGDGPWIVRSSCKDEDSATASNAGAFLSIPNVFPKNAVDAISRVITSYGEVDCDDEVLIQPMLEHVQRCGVAFSHDPNSCAPYRIINWSEGENTDFVTSGRGGHTWQQAANSQKEPPAMLLGIASLLEELLDIFNQVPVDCEFAVTSKDSNEVLWLLQARPLLLRCEPESNENQAIRLQRIQNKLARGMANHPFLMGKKTVYGVMPDWNPAEIIGIRPKPLSLSLYRELITDSIWAYQRHNYGYRNLRSFPLMPHFFGLPYIDLRISFNSFIPAGLDEDVAGRLVDHYIDRLVENPSLHDKIEFEVVFSCYTLDLQERLKRLESIGFSKNEQKIISDSLRELTNRIIHPEKGLWREDANKLDTLSTRREKLFASNADSLEKIYWLLEDARRYGTLPFAGLARAGFVAVQMLKSLVAVGVFTQEDYDAFAGSVTTVSGQLARDRSVLERDDFLNLYGHLRPGTYDILSPRYDEEPQLYFDWSQSSPEPKPTKPFSLTLPQARELVKLLESHGLNPDPLALLNFIQSGIELREMSKFHFTRNLSDAISLIIEFGKEIGIGREELAYCDISVFAELHIAAANPREMILNSIEQGKTRYKETLLTSLPPLITHPDDVWSFHLPESAPNFITQKQVTAKVVGCDNRNHIAGSIVCIPNADPGFDWLFSHSIAGFITAWGGANSHMAIRAAELGLPAVIGAGEGLYRQWSQSNRLYIDCAGRRVEVLS